jgi:hypothetical protein
MSGMCSVEVRTGLLNALFLQVSYVGPDMWLALYAADSSDEVSTARYPMLIEDWVIVTDGDSVQVENLNEVSFDEVPAITSAGAMLVDAITGGNIVASADFTNSAVTVPQGSTVTFEPGELVFSLDPSVGP